MNHKGIGPVEGFKTLKMTLGYRSGIEHILMLKLSGKECGLQRRCCCCLTNSSKRVWICVSKNEYGRTNERPFRLVDSSELRVATPAQLGRRDGFQDVGLELEGLQASERDVAEWWR